MQLVIDASVTTSWLLPDENSPEAEAWLEILNTVGGFAPVLWLYEVTNICVMAIGAVACRRCSWPMR